MRAEPQGGTFRRTTFPVSTGEILEEELTKPLVLTKYPLAKDIGVLPQRIGDIVTGKRAISAISAITANTDLRLCRYLGMNDSWWAVKISGPFS